MRITALRLALVGKIVHDLGVRAIGRLAEVQKMNATAPSVNPAAVPASNTRSPRWTRPASTASVSASGMDAATQLPRVGRLKMTCSDVNPKRLEMLCTPCPLAW